MASVGIVTKKRKDYTFQRQFNEKPSTIPGCPGGHCHKSERISMLGVSAGHPTDW